MTRYAIVQDGVVVNVIEADAGFAAGLGAIPGNGASPGDTWNGSSFSRPVQTPAVPNEIERWRGHYMLIAQGKMPAVLAAIDAIEDPIEQDLVRVEFYQRPTWRRLSALTQRLQQAAEVTDEQRDAWFIAAAAL